MALFINFSNHSSDQWDINQKTAAMKYGNIKDIEFPLVIPNATRNDIAHLAELYGEEIMSYHPAAVMCQGEFTLAYGVINYLKARGIKVVAACTDRKVEEYVDESNKKIKKTIFEFVQFREYV